MVFISVLLSLGTARFLRINPFSKSGSETGIDFVHEALQKLSTPANQEKKEAEDIGR